MWKQFCEINDGYEQKRPGLEKINEKYVTTDKNSKVDSVVKDGTTTYTTSLKITIPKAVFEINHWDQVPAKDDSLWDNPCWLSILRPDDPGYALLTNDDWYIRNPPAQQYTAAYHNPPPNALTKGPTKKPAQGNRPIVAVRTLHSPDTIYARDPPETCAAPELQPEGDVEPSNQRKRQVFVDKDGDEYVELFPDDPIDFSALEPLPSLSKPREVEAIPSDVANIEEKINKATPGSAIAAGLPQPTKALS
ncbi:hypothetical protein AJ79_01948 [Helicocarpus griseus UAMH5409]|uniref:Uncharacterized protein n=1 Tax=Helicocarpus griseus UAMH5409 TaxID=1447875 RepID=A0A2B7Y5A1_9EURO|nr:hypothetical protein AJ79_01948 [Helicocarpus griseus UAMH5409]